MSDLAAGQTIYAEDLLAGIDANTAAIADINSGWPKCRVATPSSMTIPTETQTPFQLQVAPYNVGGIHPGGVNTTLTLPRDGIYLCEAYALWSTIDTVGIRQLIIRRNSVADVVALNPEGLGGVMTPVNCSAVAYFNAGETIQALVWQDSGSDLDVTGWVTVTYMGTV